MRTRDEVIEALTREEREYLREHPERAECGHLAAFGYYDGYGCRVCDAADIRMMANAGIALNVE